MVTSAQDLESATQENEHDFYQTTEATLLLDQEIDIIIELGKHPKSVIYASESVESDASELKLHLFGFFLMLCLLI